MGWDEMRDATVKGGSEWDIHVGIIWEGGDAGLSAGCRENNAGCVCVCVCGCEMCSCPILMEKQARRSTTHLETAVPCKGTEARKEDEFRSVVPPSIFYSIPGSK